MKRGSVLALCNSYRLPRRAARDRPRRLAALAVKGTPLAARRQLKLLHAPTHNTIPTLETAAALNTGNHRSQGAAEFP